MTTRYVLLIGTHKTGTSSIKAFLAANRLALRERGIDSPVIGRIQGRAQAHSHFSAFFRNEADEFAESFFSVIERGFTDVPMCELLSCAEIQPVKLWLVKQQAIASYCRRHGLLFVGTSQPGALAVADKKVSALPSPEQLIQLLDRAGFAGTTIAIAASNRDMP